jgi:V-type H+-transporting ATPase subunit E
MEPEVFIRCRESDADLVESVVDLAVKDYQEIMAKEVSYLHGKKPPINLVFDKSRFLPEYKENTADVNSCIGGILAHCKKGRIVCSNTFNERLILCYGEAIPDIRKILFPSMKRD